MSIVYSAMRHKSYYNCSLATNTPTGNTFYACAGLNKALQAVTYSCWIFTFTYIGTLYALAKKHGTHEWTRGESGLDTPVGYLNPAQPKNSGPEVRPFPLYPQSLREPLLTLSLSLSLSSSSSNHFSALLHLVPLPSSAPLIILPRR